ncbi:alpha/beta-hydrolase [Gloeophyllum trabeum ATCC 11539]|uniref:Alpha/beta-hydrolase n=1 Tax=Gloeophyllum trabeum (strain ATCC 11539 / FP-39264 / Madison 617) TaxID=670483 RepID=S7RER3_GLOTA|nr:alpha/beta-hydrolase [Gloeophyllum trabeum ATCC 11539]EPQ50964.1 alpha/beta-hydrolase [Gloeophyllum trabeum ATCC 11539]
MSSDADSPDYISLTLPYKVSGGKPILLDLYIPAHTTSTESDIDAKGSAGLPSVVYFHGGGLTVGNKTSWFPHWLQTRLNKAEVIFISADYRLIPPATGHDILADVVDLFEFLSTRANDLLHQHLPDTTTRLDPDAMAVAGTSSGGLCAYLAAMHARPKPKAVLSMYGMGGDFLTPQYLAVKTEPFFRGREMLDPASFGQYTYPKMQSGRKSGSPRSGDEEAMISDSPLAYHPATSPTPGYPASPRMQLTRLYLQLGVFLDYYTGCHEPSLSAQLREALTSSSDDDAHLEAHMRSLIPDEHLCLFPQFDSLNEWPPALLVHGTSDTADKIRESEHLHALLQGAGVDVILKQVEGEEHSFDYQADAEERFGRIMFDDVAEFLVKRLQLGA